VCRFYTVETNNNGTFICKSCSNVKKRLDAQLELETSLTPKGTRTVMEARLSPSSNIPLKRLRRASLETRYKNLAARYKAEKRKNDRLLERLAQFQERERVNALIRYIDPALISVVQGIELNIDSDNFHTFQSCANDCLEAGDESLTQVLLDGTGSNLNGKFHYPEQI
jgi:hypothetical protein